MSVHTHYDERRDYLRKQLDECVRLAKVLFTDEECWGYDSMKEDYALDVYTSVKKARDSV